ncbi:MAG: ABC transporter ATP-binding protein [Candidatus Yonathbacteria bacterium]|nr:ABC transporter ATP-binding protein [Candidatus Yonathbacteria bacterium]NTW48027.1 ABC transporter ATP-binding protein [Candidatus Yonathbacteria bacterium]
MKKVGKNKKKMADIRKGLAVTFRQMRPYRPFVVFLSVTALFQAFANGVTPYILGRFFDGLINPTDISLFGYTAPVWVVAVAVWALLRFVTIVSEWASGIKSIILSEKMYSGYLVSGMEHLFSLPLSFHKQEKSGEVRERLNKAADSIFTVLQNLVIGLFPELLSVVIGLWVMFVIQPLFASIVVAGILSYLVILYFRIPVMAEHSSTMHKGYRKVFGFVSDAMTNIGNVKQASSEREETQKIKNGFEKGPSKILVENHARWEAVGAFRSFLLLTVQGSIFILSVAFVRSGSMTLGELVMFNGYTAMAFGPFVRMGNMWSRVQNGLIALAHSEETLVLPSEQYEPEDGYNPQDVRGDVSFAGVTFAYDKGGKKRDIIKNVSFSVSAGETVAFVGGSGAGKSTLMDLVSAYFFPKKGRVCVDGVDVKKWYLRTLRRSIAVVPQELVLFNGTVYENIKYGSPRATKAQVQQAAKSADAHDFIMKFPKGYKQVVGERGMKLSAGQKQRIAIARAVLRDPRILILDEPTSALDAESERNIQHALDRLMEGRTTLIIAHRLSTVRKADKILVLKDGAIHEQGTHEELLKKDGGLYKHLHELQMGVRNVVSSPNVDIEKVMNNLN